MSFIRNTCKGLSLKISGGGGGGGVPKDRNDDQMIEGNGDTTIDPKADLQENSDNVSA